MLRNRVQHQKGLSDYTFERIYPDEAQGGLPEGVVRPEGFKCPRARQESNAISATFAWRLNRRFVLKSIHERLAIAATTTPPMPYRLLKLAEARW
jgi:hypothetical protein